MKLHTNIREGKTGTVFKKDCYLFDFRLELSLEETALYQRHGQKLDRIMFCKAPGFDTEYNVSVRDALQGKRDMTFYEMHDVETFEQNLKNGCGGLANHFESLRALTGGRGEGRVFEIS